MKRAGPTLLASEVNVETVCVSEARYGAGPVFVRAVPVKLGRAVKHAGLSPHEQVPYPLGGKRRKDFDDRVRDQGSPLPADKIATISWIRAIVATASNDTILSTNLRHPQPHGFDRAANHQSCPHIAPGRNYSPFAVQAL